MGKMKFLKKLILFLCVNAFFLNISFGQGGLDRISVKGNSFVNQKGDTLVFRGMSTSDPDKLELDGLWNKNYFNEIKDWGANLIRFPIHPSRVRNRGFQEYLKLLDDGIKWAGELGVYVVLDWHSIGNIETGIYLLDMYDTTKKETYNFWKVMAERHGKNNTVAFYEIFNEPTTNDNRYGALDWDSWKGFNKEVITIIRANGGEGIPLVAGFNWAYDLTPVKWSPLEMEGIGYVSHPYPQKREKPWEEKWTNDWGFVKDNYPLILTEMGFCGPEDPGAHIPVISDESYGISITDYCDARQISYLVWVFDMEWAPNMFTDRKFTPSRQGKFFKEKFKSYPYNK
ncbi:cellulase family glycosylhydrolase [Muricauda sp. ANG21]|uniref:glycoside hydrolase family 5 protein n=1 Tax=Allomuricauda sp. ANG21 TaxID=3042468 RepID=UPI003456FD1A